MRSFWGLVLVFAVAACRPHATTATAPSPSSPGAADAAVPIRPAPPPAASASGAASELAPVGMSETTLPSREAVASNDAGVALLRKGKIDEASSKLRHALELEPAFVLARYNLACVVARAGDFDEAERQLGLVVETDWIGLRAQIARDTDLDGFRASAQGKRLAAREQELDARYGAALARGVRAMLWGARSPEDVVPAPGALRVGVWDATTKRFVATNERSNAAIGAFVTSDLPYAVVVGAEIPKMLGGDLSDHIFVKELSLWTYTGSGKPLAVTPVGRGAFTGAAHVRGDEVTLLIRSAFGYDPVGSDRYMARLTFSPGRGATNEVGRDFQPPKEEPSRTRGMLVLPFHNGFETWAVAPGFALEGTRLKRPDGRVTELPKALVFSATKPSIVASPAGDVALVWDTHSCGMACGGNMVTVGAHRIVLVTKDGASEKIAEGTGVGAARWDPSGRMFVQRDRRTYEWGAAPTALPEGVLLVAPVVRERDVQCCGF